MNDTYTKFSYGSGSDDREETVDPMSRLSFASEDAFESDTAPLVPSGPKKVPGVADMVVEAVKSNSDKRGASLQYIKSYCKNQYSVSDAMMKRRLKPAIEKCLNENRVVRPKLKKGAKEPSGIQGRFKVAVDPKESATMKNKTKAASQDQVSQKKKGISVKEKSLSVKLAQSKVKHARLSLAAPKEKPVPKTRSMKTKNVSTARKFPVMSVAVTALKMSEGKSLLTGDDPPEAGTSSKATKKSLKEKSTQGKPNKRVVKRKVVKEADKKATKAKKQKPSTETEASLPTKPKSAPKAKGRPRKSN